MGDEARERREPATAGNGAVQIGGAGGAVFVVQPRVELQDQDGNPIGPSITAETDSSGTVTFTTTAIDPDRSTEAADARPELPVYAAWPQSAAFCARLGMRLPTEAEWEYACRAGVQAGRYGPLDEIAWHRGNARGRRQPVGMKAANALGFHDMIGNAWEWVNDWYGEYSRGAQTNPMGPSSGDSRIARGSYFNYEDGFCRSSQRYEMQSPDFAGAMGFRVARNP
jgi:formylglycine-generating enzyme required for sulfatase activity